MIFAVDDSEIMIEGRPHTILAAVAFDKPDETKERICSLKAQFGLRSDEEIKWNGTRLENRQQREAMSRELLGVLSPLKLFVTVTEGVDRQEAMEHLGVQLDDFLQHRSEYVPEPSTVHVICDNGIIKNPLKFGTFLKESERARLKRLTFESVRSEENELIQCADICAGFSRLLIDFGLGRVDRRLILLEEFPDGSTNTLDTDVRHLILFSLRYSLWGEIPPPPDPDNIIFDGTYPFLHTAGLGLRIHSSVPGQTITRIQNTAGVVYYGCLH